MIDKKLKLIEPSIDYQKEYTQFLEDFKSTKEKLVPFILEYDTSKFPGFIQKLKDSSMGIGLPEGWIPHTTFWLVDPNKNVIGVVNIRHKINDKLERIGGHIGFSIAPSYRRKGYGKIILKLALDKVSKFGLKQVLLTCDKENIGSVKVIKYNNGVLDSEDIVDGMRIQRYWIKI
ncbi:MAG: GNAT family N-acetyltransferase [Thermoplasmata archaeon]|nr:MAG: GNAT family N-acetyltransferase [Thermoplasmata archaeon]